MGQENLAGAVFYPIGTQALPDLVARCPGGIEEVPVRLAVVANAVLVTGVQPALLQAVGEALSLDSHVRPAKPAARLVIGQGAQEGTIWATPVRLPHPG
eukprot:7747361-Alexandrium_andersonii.AAC.1